VPYFFLNSHFIFLDGLSTIIDMLFKLDNFVRRYINYKIIDIFLEARKAFDCINHKFLLNKN